MKTPRTSWRGILALCLLVVSVLSIPLGFYLWVYLSHHLP